MALTSLTKPKAIWMTIKWKATSAVSRSLYDKLLDKGVSPKDFGAVGDGVTDDGDALRATIGFLNNIKADYKKLDLSGGTYFFTGILTLSSNMELCDGLLSLDDSSGNVIIVSGSNVRVTRVTFTGKSSGVISIKNNSSSVTVSDCVFDSSLGATGRLNQVIWLFACDGVKVQGNTFIECGYGIITQPGYVSNNIIITENICREAYQDFVEANSANVKCINWSITNNIYTGGAGWPTQQIERRFVGVTEVENVTITGNIVMNVPGDSAVHLEDLYGKTIISDNIFENWNGNSCIYLLSSAEDTVITGNMFLRTSTDCNANVINTSSGSYTNVIIVSSNYFEDQTGEYLLRSVIMAFNGQGAVISNNVARYCSYLLRIQSSNNIVVSGNKVVQCTAGILGNTAEATTGPSTGGGGENIVVTGNLIDVIDTDLGIYSRTNSNGTQGPKYWLITGNITNGNITMRNGSGSVGQTLYNAATANTLKGGAVVSINDFGGTGKAKPDADGNFITP